MTTEVLERSRTRIGERVLRMKQLREKLNLAQSTIYEMVNGGDFPPPFSLGAGAAKGWLESEVDAWLAKRAADSRKGAAR